MSDGVTLRLHPDGHWMPNTPGCWVSHCLDDPSLDIPTPVEVYEFKGGLMVRYPCGNEKSVRQCDPARWEWVPPKGPTEITP